MRLARQFDRLLSHTTVALALFLALGLAHRVALAQQAAQPASEPLAGSSTPKLIERIWLPGQDSNLQPFG